jgi:replication factor A1
MIKLPYEELIAKIVQDSGISEDELNEKIEEKLSSLSGLVSKDGAAHIIANELGVKLLVESSGRIQINKIFAGMRSVSLLAKVQRIFEERTFDTGKHKGKVRSFIAGDETGTIRIVLWNDQVDKIQTIKEGDIIHLENAYVKENNNQKELHLGDKAKIEINPPGETVGDVKITPKTRSRKRIQELTDADANVEVLGTIVQVFEPRYYEICPFCSKRARPTPGAAEFICEQHGKITPKYAYVLNAVVDDGSGTVRTVFFKNQAENLLGKQEDYFLSIKDSQEKIEQMKTELLGEIVKLVGRVSKNENFNRLEFVSQLVFRNPDPEEELKVLEQQV